MPPKSTTTQPLKHKPKQAVRRSKEEREAIERSENERRQARAHAAAADEAIEAARKRQQYGIHAPRKDKQREDRYQGNPVTYRIGRGGRGGFMGSTRPTGVRSSNGAGTRQAGTAEGGGGSTTIRAEAGTSRPTSSTIGKKASGSTSKATPAVKSEIDELQPGYPRPVVKKEDPEYTYISEGEDGIGGRNVDAIEISSDSEDGSAAGSVDVETEESRRVLVDHRKRRLGFIPHRIQRNEHRDRIIGINTESSAANAIAGDRLEQEGQEHSAKRKGKIKVSIKPDPEVEAMEGLGGPSLDTEMVELSDDGEPEALDGPSAAAEDEGEGSKDTISAKIRKPRSGRTTHLTNEERAERDRQEQSLRDVQAEFGRVSVDSRPAQESDAANGDGDTEDAAASHRAGSLDNVAYIFQFPPILPDLYSPKVKDDPDEAIAEASYTPLASSTKLSTNHTANDPVKVEDNGYAVDTEPPSAGHARRPYLQPGHAGKLRIHASGKMSLSWGGTSLQATTGTNPQFLQMVMLMNLNKAGSEKDEERDELENEKVKRREELGFKGAATSFGRVRGKIVVTPDWEEILG